MKQYKFELVICEGNDEFWDAIPFSSSGCDEVSNFLKDLLSDVGFVTDGEYQNCKLTLKEFKGE